MTYYQALTHLILLKNLTLTIVLLMTTAAIMTIPNMAFAQDDLNTLISKGKLFAQASIQGPFGWWQQSFDNFDNALKIDPKNIEAQKGKDTAYNKMQEIKTSLAKYDVVLKKDPKSSEALDGECGGLAVLREFDKALPYCDKAIEYQNKYQPSNSNNVRIWILQELGRYTELLDYYANSPHMIGNPYQYVALYQVGKYDDLIKMIDADVQISGERQLLVYKAATLEKMGKNDEANTYFTVYVQALSNPDMNCFKGDIFSGLRDFEKAAYYLDKCKTDSVLIDNAKVIVHAEIENSKTGIFYSQSSNMNFFDEIIQFFKNLFHTK